jgi:hypothetical protein
MLNWLTLPQQERRQDSKRGERDRLQAQQSQEPGIHSIIGIHLLGKRLVTWGLSL